ncbi:MAG: IS30 family transposase [Planctomycetes bacterium]|nr:IS30 family transposase [Planctomycetota bacterium]
MAHHLTMEERDRIAQLRHQGADQREIARALDRSAATISRELRRNRSGDVYFAAQAHVQSQRRRRQRPLVRKIEAPELNDTVRRALTQYWSPEQIAGRLRREVPLDKAPISARTIYHWIQSDEDRPHWESFLRRRGKRPFRPKNPGGIGAPIADRPEVIEQRLRLGDFEGDTVLGAPGTGGLATLVDRKSRYTIVVKIHSKDADHVHEKIKERLKQLDEERRRSVTFDNGTEFARCKRLEKHLGMKLYFAEPGCPQ